MSRAINIRPLQDFCSEFGLVARSFDPLSVRDFNSTLDASLPQHDIYDLSYPYHASVRLLAVLFLPHDLIVEPQATGSFLIESHACT
jgi:hypothetical protein